MAEGDACQTEGGKEKEGIMGNVEAKVNGVLLEILDIKPEEVVPTARFVEDLKATSPLRSISSKSSRSYGTPSKWILMRRR